MSNVEITPANRPITATVNVPGSKSITNRALIMAAIAKGDSRLHHVLASEDTEACINALQALGVMVDWQPQQEFCYIRGCHGQFPNKQAEVFCRESGTLTRFILPICAAVSGSYDFTASARMCERPMAPLLQVLHLQGCEIAFTGKPGFLPVAMQSNGLIGAEVVIDSSQSSQFISGLLMAAPLAQQAMLIKSQNLARKTYVHMTVAMMSQFGVDVVTAQDSLMVPTGEYSGCEYYIEPDASTASYFFAAAALTGGQVTVAHLKREQSLQGDVKFLSVLEQMGCRIEEDAAGITVLGPKQLRGLGTIDMTGFSDTFMTVAALAVFADGPTELTGLAHTRLQESDRVAAMARELACLGVVTNTTNDSLTIAPSRVTAGAVWSHNDHRIAMSLALIGLKVPGLVITDAQAVAKTCPDYFAMLAGLTAE